MCASAWASALPGGGVPADRYRAAGDGRGSGARPL